MSVIKLQNGIIILTKRTISLSKARNHDNQSWSTPKAVIIYQQKSINFIKDKVASTQSWYEEFTGIRELREAQLQVIYATKKMREAQERRRDARFPMLDVQKKLQDIQPELRNTARDDDRYIQLIKQEHQLLKELKGQQVNYFVLNLKNSSTLPLHAMCIKIIRCYNDNRFSLQGLDSPIRSCQNLCPLACTSYLSATFHTISGELRPCTEKRLLLYYQRKSA